ncbi:MAG: acyl carrier protein [Lachnospiraceae bacterium]|nr:acyl carrier protein [Lachnospiraceae bacterium]
MYDKLVEIMLNYIEVKKEDITPDSRFMEDLGFTSFDFMSMLGEIEDELDVEIEQEKIVDIITVGEAVEYLESISE